MANVHDYSPQGGNIIGGDGQLYNVVDLLGSGTPVNDRLYDITQFKPQSGYIIGSDGRMYDLVEILKDVGKCMDATQDAVDSAESANAAAADANKQAEAAKAAAKRLSSVGVNVMMLAPTEAARGTVTQTESMTTFDLRIPMAATGEQGPKGEKGDPGDSDIRAVSLSLVASSWTGNGPYTATISRSDVTAKTWVDFQLTAASLANYSAAISWETAVGKIMLTTAVKPVGTLTGTMILTEVA